MNNKKTQFSEIMPLIEEQLAKGESVTFSPSGVSMLPLFRKGRDSVTLSPVRREIKKHDIVFFKREDGSFVLHRVVRVGETYDIIGDNQLYAEKNISPSQIIGVVTSFERNSKTCYLKGVGYRLYCVSLKYRRFFMKAVNKIKRSLSGRK